MLTPTQALGAVLSLSHGSFTSGSTVPSGHQWAPGPRHRHRAASKKVRSSSVSLPEVDGAALIVDKEQQPLVLTRRGEEAVAVGSITLKAMVTVRLAEEGSTPEKVADMVHRQWLSLELYSSELDPETGKERPPVCSPARYCGTLENGFFVYEAMFGVHSSFGAVGAVQVNNTGSSEVHIMDIEVGPAYGCIGAGDGNGTTTTTSDAAAVALFHCNSWVSHNPSDKRVFFPVNKSCLPSQTPRGVERLRVQELRAIRGTGSGERTAHERIYDYDVYNDLGDPDASAALRRPVLGGAERPYPRRCRTGRPRSRADPASETRAKGGDVYVPRDEAFTERKASAFRTKQVLSTLSTLLTRQEVGKDTQRSFPSLAAIDALFEDGYRNLPSDTETEENLCDYFMDLLLKQVELLQKGETEEVKEDLRRVFKFQTPEIHDKDKLAWFRDEEFARQTLAGMNPLTIQLLTELPIVSNLDEETYGPRDSLITKELIDQQIKGIMTAEEAVKKKKLFMLDYHDVLLPYVHAIRELDHTTLYGSRTLFFLTEQGTLRPIAIELTRPKSPALPQWRQVFTPAMASSVTASWLWQLAKTHVLSHDTGYHQLVSHWLRTHCCVEPYIIAANRRLSQMHPVYRLLHPHFRFTMEMNAQGRAMLISAGGVIEATFSPGKHSMELSSAVYGSFWRFDKEALPEDLIRRGMAVRGPDGELELAIEDYPYANDGLLVWDSIKEWASDYVNHYYRRAADIAGDEELQGWWTEVRTEGHADKRDEPWWPRLDCHESLVQVLTTIIWVASGHHAAVNFGQYPYAGYFPNHPTIARRTMPTEEQGCDSEGMRAFMEDPVKVLLDTYPSQYQSTLFMPTLNLLSTHMAGEQYMGTHSEPAWMADAEMRAAFLRFNARMMGIAEKIDCWNKEPQRKNREGAGVVPYVLLKPSYGDPKDMKSVMEMGIPNSISI